MNDNSLKDWQQQVKTVGFRQAAIGTLRSRVARERDRERLVRLILRLAKYEPHLEIVRLLRSNPHWQQTVEQLLTQLPEVKADPKIHFVCQTAGNIPRVPAMSEERLYFGSGEYFYAVDAESGEFLWQLHSAGSCWSSAWLAEDALFVCTGGSLLALNPADGSRRWCFQTSKTLSAPYVWDHKVFVGSEQGTIYGIDSGCGRKIWTFNVVGPIFVARGSWGKKIFVAAREGVVYCIDPAEGECLWHASTAGKIYGLPRVCNGVVYATSTDHQVYAFLANSGQLLWSFTTGGEVHGSVFEENGVVYVGSRDRYLYALRAEDGQELWKERLLGYPSTPAAARDMIYLSAQGRVYGFGAADHKMRWCVPLGFPAATSPAIKPRRLYVGTLQGKLFCLALQVKLEEEGAAQVVRQFLCRRNTGSNE
ncbi:MAG: PQQ-binding-like beta-propeller repeat protein [Deltaproteobacteria bacterium]|nr:PQQ-binding-like beta-propeller repeat protein [Deltaproteobacteria bacterium]